MTDSVEQRSPVQTSSGLRGFPTSGSDPSQRSCLGYKGRVQQPTFDIGPDTERRLQAYRRPMREHR